MIAVGLAIGYFMVYRALQAAAQGVASITLSKKLTAVTPMLIILGITLIANPQFALSHLANRREGRKMSVTGWIYVGVIVVIGIAFSEWVQSQLRGYGYQF